MRRLFAEVIGSLMLCATVIGSGILASRLSGGNDAVALLGNTAATGAILYVLIAALGPISGAHFNPAVTLVMGLRGEIKAGLALLYAASQVVGCMLGAWLAHAMFALPIVQVSSHARAGGSQVLSEAVATFALLFTILSLSRSRPQSVPAGVALVITAGYWWTASTSFANPAITIARAMSDTFAGIRPMDVPGFLAGQLAGAICAWIVCLFLLPKEEERL
ncbi:MAG: aquaporin family protein [Alphaproteobacteria bacterium]|nr:aquaporin family protein [Alphaproteobacteria bacterium]